MLKQLQNILLRTEEVIIIALLGVMVLLSGTQIFLRNVMDSGISWGDPLLRVMVLWVGLMGAMLATRQNKHIRIDVLSRYLPEGWKRASNTLTGIFSTIVCGLLTWHSGRFVHYEWQDGTEIFSGFPSWLAELILPVGFSIITLRFALLAWQSMKGEAA